LKDAERYITLERKTFKDKVLTACRAPARGLTLAPGPSPGGRGKIKLGTALRETRFGKAQEDQPENGCRVLPRLESGIRPERVRRGPQALFQRLIGGVLLGRCDPTHLFLSYLNCMPAAAIIASIRFSGGGLPAGASVRGPRKRPFYFGALKPDYGSSFSRAASSFSISFLTMSQMMSSSMPR
jgi:hypothetical protein